MYIFAFKDQANTNKYSNSLKIYPDGEFFISDLLYHFLKLLFRFHYSFKNISPYCNCSSHSNKFFNILQACQEAKNCGILAVPPSRIQEHFMDSSTLNPLEMTSVQPVLSELLQTLLSAEKLMPK